MTNYANNSAINFLLTEDALDDFLHALDYNSFSFSI